jgi:hypothetical protein
LRFTDIANTEAYSGEFFWLLANYAARGDLALLALALFHRFCTACC